MSALRSVTPRCSSASKRFSSAGSGHRLRRGGVIGAVTAVTHAGSVRRAGRAWGVMRTDVVGLAAIDLRYYTAFRCLERSWRGAVCGRKRLFQFWLFSWEWNKNRTAIRGKPSCPRDTSGRGTVATGQSEAIARRRGSSGKRREAPRSSAIFKHKLVSSNASNVIAIEDLTMRGLLATG